MYRTSSPVSLLVLWDIDLTLMCSGALGSTALAMVRRRRGFEPPEAEIGTPGRTDAWILRQVLSAAGVEATRAEYDRVESYLTSSYAELDGELRRRGKLMPGAMDTLEALNQVPGVLQSVLTGNLAPIARQKLRSVGLDPLLRLDVGAYGADSPDRADLVPAAWERVQRVFSLPAPPPTVIIGDTIHDVQAANVHNLPCVGVSADPRVRAELTDAGASVVLASLAPAPHAVRVILDLVDVAFA